MEESSARPLGRAFLSRCLPTCLPNLNAHLVFWLVIVLGTTLDLWSKKAVFQWLQHRPDHSFSVIDGFLTLVMAENSGAAFGIASGQRWALAAVSITALVIVFGIFFFSRTRQKSVHLALALFAAGILGNLWDRLFNDGLVRDFIDVVYWPGKHWPAFNVADTMLCVAVAALLLSNLFTHWSYRRRPPQRK